jgi:hypothetical protein
LNRNKIQEAKIEELLSELREKKQYIKELEEYIRTQPNRKTTGVSYQQLKKNYRKKFVQ